MSKLKPYDEYQPVSYDYVAEVPEGWQLLPNLAIFQERIERGHEDKELLSVTISRGVIKQSELDKKDSSTLDKSKYLLVYPGDLVYSMRFRQGASGYSIHKGIVSPACTVLRPKKGTEINPRYFYYMFRTGFYKNYVERFAYGIADGQIPLRYVDFKRMYSIVPPLETQNEIVQYLDRKTQQIKAFIQKKERLIELLEEEKVSISSDLLNTLNKAYWKKLKYYKRFSNGYAFKSQLFGDEGVPIFRIGDVRSDYSIEKCPKYPLNEKVDAKFELDNGDILMALSGATTGKCTRLEGLKTKAYVNQRVALLKNAHPYILMCLQSHHVQDQITLIADGSAQENISNKDIENILMPLPDIKTQTKISNAFNDRVNPIDSTIQKAKSEIEKAKEYQESLITQVVTGQLKVPALTIEKVLN